MFWAPRSLSFSQRYNFWMNKLCELLVQNKLIKRETHLKIATDTAMRFEHPERASLTEGWLDEFSLARRALGASRKNRQFPMWWRVLAISKVKYLAVYGALRDFKNSLERRGYEVNIADVESMFWFQHWGLIKFEPNPFSVTFKYLRPCWGQNKLS